MSGRLNQFTAVLLGTSSNKVANGIAHLLFWVLMLKWFLFQAKWVTGDKNVLASYVIGFQKYIIIVAFFYFVSYLIRLKESNLKIGFYIFLSLVALLLSYGIMVYYLYNYINIHQVMPPYYQRFVLNISAAGPWTFIRNGDVFSFHFEQLGLALFLPFTIKVFRVAFQSNLQKLKLEKDNLALELNFLRSQINPHFLFNTLNSVYSLIEDKDETAASIIFSLSNMMRYALYDSNITEIEASKELNFIKSYIDIQNIRHSKRLSVEMDFPENISGFKLPPLLLINFVENAFKHGVDKITRDSWIKIKAFINNSNEFCFEISNLKPESKNQDVKGGIGVSNTKRRLDILYPERHLLEIIEDNLTYNLSLKIW